VYTTHAAGRASDMLLATFVNLLMPSTAED